MRRSFADRDDKAAKIVVVKQRPVGETTALASEFSPLLGLKVAPYRFNAVSRKTFEWRTKDHAGIPATPERPRQLPLRPPACVCFAGAPTRNWAHDALGLCASGRPPNRTFACSKAAVRHVRAGAVGRGQRLETGVWECPRRTGRALSRRLPDQIEEGDSPL